MTRIAALVSLGLAACNAPSTERVVAPPVVEASASVMTPMSSAAPAAGTLPDAAAPSPFRVGVGVQPDEDVATLDELSATTKELCKTFSKKAKHDAEEIARSFSFRQRTPACALRPAPAGFRPGGAYLDARVLQVTYVSRSAHLLAVQLARGWVISWIAWDVDEAESATPAWSAHAPERFEIDGAHLVAYLPGGDLASKRGASDERLLRGAFVCTDDGTRLACAKWDPTVRAPLGIKIGKSASPSWATLPWTQATELVWQTDSSLVARSVP